MKLSFIPESGFVGVGPQGPQIDKPEDWIIWHFTHKANLPAIADVECLRAASAVEPVQNVALNSVKQRRFRTVDLPPPYPACTVNDHVPFYIAAKSPMLYVVNKGHENYSGGSNDLVFLGARLGDVTSSGVTWCASNANAAAATTQFTTDITALGTFVDFTVLRQRDWYKTTEDPDRMSRRAAEVLVLGEVPLTLVTIVATRSDAVLHEAQAALKTVGGIRQYDCLPELYY